jgi:predicted nucleotidyltransferase component of viral defense system
MRNAMQLKAYIRKEAAERKISAQVVLQNYMLERLLERISTSDYRRNFILKGGFLISAMVGLDTRTTMDMDATIKELPMDGRTIRKLLDEICAIPVDDGVAFHVNTLEEIRKNDEYQGFRASLTAVYETMAIPLKLDFTTGDRITPREIEYEYQLHFEDRKIRVLAYNLETLLAEKYETVLSRGDQNTRPRDYYDIHILLYLQGERIDVGLLRKAACGTFM